MFIVNAKVGKRIVVVSDALSPMDRYGTITKVGSKWIHAQMDSGRRAKFMIEGQGSFAPAVSGLKLI